jgi:hypothetical protein
MSINGHEFSPLFITCILVLVTPPCGNGREGGRMKWWREAREERKEEREERRGRGGEGVGSGKEGEGERVLD